MVQRSLDCSAEFTIFKQLKVLREKLKTRNEEGSKGSLEVVKNDDSGKGVLQKELCMYIVYDGN